MDLGMDPRIGGMLGSMIAQPMGRNSLAGNPFGQMSPQGPTNIGGSQNHTFPDGSINTSALEQMLERAKSQNKLKKIKDKEQQQLTAMALKNPMGM